MPRELVPRRLGVEIWALATPRHGVVTRGELLALGFSPQAIRTTLERGHLRPLHRGVYMVGHGSLSQRGRWMAAVLAGGPGAVLSHRSAAALRGLVPGDRGRPHISVPRGDSRAIPGVVVHRIAWIAADSAFGIPCTTVARTLLDLAGLSRRRALERALDEAAVQGALDLRAIDDALARVARPRGVALLRSVLAEHSPGTTRTRSELEEAFLALSRRAGLPTPVVNGIVVERGEEMRIDFQWPRQRLAVETDGARYHRHARAKRKDRRWDRVLQLAGWTVLRFPEEDVHERPAEIVADLRRALACRGTS